MKSNFFKFNESVLAAIEAKSGFPTRIMFSHGVLILHGAQGSGKTTIANKIAGKRAIEGYKTIIHDNCIASDMPSFVKILAEAEENTLHLVLMQKRPDSCYNMIHVNQMKEILLWNI